MVINLPTDQAVRDQALSPGRSFHLEAPAGSGKTSVLLARFLSLLARVEAPEELLALTFTRKAAGELRTRVMQLLWEREEPGADASPHEVQLRELAQQVFDRHGDGAQLKLTPERLPIMTFHSFCAQLLRLSPQEAEAPLDFQLLEEDEARWVKQEALEELRRRLSARPSRDPGRQALVRRLVRLNNDWRRLAGELQGLLARRDSLQEFLDLARLSRDPEAYRHLLETRFQLTLRPALGALAQGLAASALGQAWPQFWQALQGAPLAENPPAAIPGTAPRDLAAWQAVAQALLTKEGVARKSFTPKLGFPGDFDKVRWGGMIRALPAEVVRGLKQCRELTPSGASPQEAAALQDLVILLGEALTVYAELCSRGRALDFVALEQAALKLLTVEDPGELLLRLDQRLTHLLVDEFQDTSQNQLDLLCRLLAGWQKGEGRTLMVVGDPKQSIYGWRQAKPRLFLDSRQGLPCPEAAAVSLTPLLLTTNFRASRTLIAWANQVFGDTVMGPAAGGEIDFHAADPGPGAAVGPAPHLALFAGGDDLTPRQHEAHWLARQVAGAIPTLSANDIIGILLFTRTHLPVYLKALNDAGVAVKVREGLKLADSRVAAHLHNLARALTRPGDGLAWAAVMRGPWAPQSLEVLAGVAQTPGELWLEKLRHYAGRKECPRDLSNLAVALSEAQGRVGRRPLAEILVAFLRDTGAWTGLAAWEGPGGVATGRAYLDLLQAAESGLPEATFSKADFTLEEAYQPPDPRAQDSPVQVLTVHGAKGLEFTQVFLPFLDWQPLRSEEKTPPFLLEEIPGAPGHGLALARPYLQEKQSSLYLLLRNIKNQRVLDEARRVFYVAVTRARQRLVLSAVVKPNQEPQGESPLGWLGSHYRQPLPPPGTVTDWPGPEMVVELAGEISGAAVPEIILEPLELPDPLKFQPEPAPYQMSYPAQLAEMGEDWQAGEDPEAARLRGEVMHRALETLAQGGELPEAAALAAALRQGGLTPAAAAGLAPEILAELEACQADPFLARLLAPGLPEARSEWLLEDRPAPDTIRRGKMDRLVFDGATWWLLDYKTSRPADPGEWEEFMAREQEKYRPQLLAYRQMTARAQGLPPETIRPVLYFTACQRPVEI
jgi:ATP-dependent exoDNAse (exonuclease V) beta subunit